MTETETARLRGFFMQSLRWTWEAAAAVIAPADCRACGGALLQANGLSVCAMCLNELQPETGELCVQCGERLAMEEARGAGFAAEGVGRCESCFAEAPAFAQATAFAPYDGTLRTLIRLHKFEGVERLARPLGERLAPVLARAAELATPGAEVRVIAVPLFGRKRAFNQSVQLVAEALRSLRRRHAGVRLQTAHASLVRVRQTESQSHLTPTQRRNNVRGAFAVRGDVKGWSVLLVDDVYTTGATAKECTRVLLRAGAHEVRVVTLARTQREGASLWSGATGWGKAEVAAVL